MPELPEVETIVRALRNGRNNEPSILGRLIVDANVYWQNSIAVPDVDSFLMQIRKQEVKEIDRRGKYIVLGLTDGFFIIHLRMSGDIRVEAAGEESDVLKHDRISILFDDGSKMVFNDTRKFGRAWLVKDKHSVLGKLGIEPLSSDFSGTALYQKLQMHRRQIKPLLMDQHFIAGIGNIYADEALHQAGINPKALSHELEENQAVSLARAIINVLEAGIEANGASIDWVYRGGDFQNRFQVYHRTGLPCYQCGQEIKRIIVGQRSTHYCPQCQPMSNAKSCISGNN